MHLKTKRTVASESSANADGLRWSIERRLAYVEQRLFWLGAINRTDLIRRYGVSTSQASADINRYLALNPRGVSYDKSAKCYVADDRFRPRLGPPDSARLLGELRLIDAGILSVEESLLGTTPPFDATPLPQRPVDPLVLRALWRSVASGKVLEVVYQSMSRPEPGRRRLEPHALAHDGFRWHARAFDEETGSFRDFVLGRMAEPAVAESAKRSAQEDTAWNEWIELHIAPHPDLTPAQSKAIRLDYGIDESSFSVLRVRRALLYYALRQLGLDTHPDARLPSAQHIVLVNRDAVMRNLALPEET